MSFQSFVLCHLVIIPSPTPQDRQFLFRRYQDVHNQSFIMVMASGRWLAVRLELLSSLLIGAVALAAVLVAQDAGRYICNPGGGGTSI